ncbi:hypothetical protein [Vibrio spartinae]|uniref:Uncharacterized protein n=1 Tax=Vibrio spartinae TaxID=1918945 RepID=A0A1N6M9S1_9VIBR|nr:hypothetical protein [Vibrio spartinae]SIO96107.1 hypothetical protein VSP9026_03867 [Vibrio spartinae]
MLYKELFKNALIKTQKLGLSVPESILPFKSSLSDSLRDKIYLLAVGVAQRHGFEDSSTLAGKCIPVHLAIHMVLKKILGVNSIVTIGERRWYNDVYCEMSYEYIEKEINSPQSDKTLDAHIWLTLPDGTILDLTSEAHQDIQSGRGNYQTHECIIFTKPDEELSLDDGKFIPFLVGHDFLFRTDCFDLEGHPNPFGLMD